MNYWIDLKKILDGLSQSDNEENNRIITPYVLDIKYSDEPCYKNKKKG